MSEPIERADHRPAADVQAPAGDRGGDGAPQVAASPSLLMRRRIAAPPAMVYAAWTRPEQLARWWGPAGAETTSAELDVRVGGRFFIRFSTPDGEQHGVGGVYREVVPAERLRFDWAWQSTPERLSLVTVRLAPDGEGTLLTLIHEQFFDEQARAGHERGWTVGLDRLAAHLEAAA